MSTPQLIQQLIRRLGLHVGAGTCLLCASQLLPTDSPSLCNFCGASLPCLKAPCCRCCALPLNIQADFCGPCLAHPPAFAQARIAYEYAYPLDELLRSFKYQQDLAAGQLLARLLVMFIQMQLDQGDTPRPDALVATPIHWQRRWLRGFNQTELLARELAKALHLPLLDACQCCTPHHSQQGLDRQARLRNLRHSFVVRPQMRALIQGKHLALIDDVVTTGATAHSLSAQLLQAGASRVEVWAIARTPAPGVGSADN